MISSAEFQPDWASAPGETVRDVLWERGISEETFASLMDLDAEETKDLLGGRSTITIAIARQLAICLGGSVEFWMSRDHQYRENSSRLKEAERTWLRQLPIADMVKFGWLSPRPFPSDELAACLRFFAVASISEWRNNYGSLQEKAAFRSSLAFDSRHEAVAAWLRQGEIEANDIDCQAWNPERFQEILSGIRSMTRIKDPKRFVPALQEACSRSGVAVVVVRSPTGCHASGATQFVATNKAVLQLSFRYLTDDHFWFTFFHEAGHLVLHGEKHFFAATLDGAKPWILEGTEVPEREDEERDANEFAANILIPPNFQPEFQGLLPNTRAVLRFAHRIGVSPGIVVGQLQHAGRIGFDQMNTLKRRFVW